MNKNGFTYVEVLVATVMVALLLIPSMEAFNTSIAANKIYTDKLSNHYRLIYLMEQTLVDPFAALEEAATIAGNATTPTSYSDPAGTDARRVVFIASYDIDNADGDGDPFTGTDPDILWVSVSIENSDDSLVTLVTQ